MRLLLILVVQEEFILNQFCCRRLLARWELYYLLLLPQHLIYVK